MKVGDFVRDTLLEVIRGVNEAADSTSTAIAPNDINGERVATGTEIEFEMSVVVDAKSGGQLRIFQVADVGGDVGRQSSHRVSFRVPTFFGAHWINRSEKSFSVERSEAPNA
jgi:hypothetical protein